MAPAAPAEASWLQRLGTAAQRARLWLFIGMAFVLAYIDFRLKGDFRAALIGFLVAAGAGVAWRLGGKVLAPLTRILPEAIRGLVLVGLPIAVLYLTRWQGTQKNSHAFLTMGLVLGLGFLLAKFREPIRSWLGPYYQVRNSWLSTRVRMILAFVLPLVISFTVAHGNLFDIFAFIGFPTQQAAVPTGRTGGFWIPLAAVLSAVVVFLVLDDPTGGVSE